jgi:hypothetical protein
MALNYAGAFQPSWLWSQLRQQQQQQAQPGVMTSPPPGSYDPALDAQVGQANRGLGDLLSDYVRDYGEPGTALGGRAGEDYQTGRANVQRGLDWGLEDVNRGADRTEQDIRSGSERSLADLLRGSGRALQDLNRGADRGAADLQRGSGRALQDVNLGADRSLADLQRGSGRTIADLVRDRGRAGEDYQSNVEGLRRNYARLGAQQGQVARQAGVQRGGALAQALMKRRENEAIDRRPMDVGFARFGEDSAQAEGRVREDTALGEGRIGEDRGLRVGRINEDTSLGLGRIGEDRELGTGRINEDKTAAHFRLAEDFSRGLTRVGEDRATGVHRLNTGAQSDFAGLDRGLLRGTEDAATQLARAQRENAQFGLDANAQRFFQADMPIPQNVAAANVQAPRPAPRRPAARPMLPVSRANPWPYARRR